MQLVHEQLVPDPVQLASASPPTARTTTQNPLPPEQLQREFVTRTAWRQGVIASLNVATQILAVRLILLIAIAGAIVLAWSALAQPDPMRLGALGIYLAGAVLPVVWLSGRR